MGKLQPSVSFGLPSSAGLEQLQDAAMDFWSRLVGGPKKTAKPHPDPNSPQVRLAHLRSWYNELLRIWNNGDGVSADAFVAENVRICIRRMAELLTEDQRGPTPHACLQFAATSRILVTIARVAAAFCDEGITQEALAIASLLIDSEDRQFLEDRAFADALPDFVEKVRSSDPALWDRSMESSMVEVLFNVASKIRLEPLVLAAWFRPEDRELEFEGGQPQRKSRVDEFRLFYLLLYYTPTQGRSGEFARMGLLYLIEAVSHSKKYEAWLVEGDIAAMLASGLGALYSQLSRKLAITYRDDERPTILQFSRAQQQNPAFADATTSPEYQDSLSTFLSSLLFWQDVLGHCPSQDVRQTLLDHFQYLFLQQLLYPSLLESSDVDGGSSVAVLTYLRHIVESIEHPDLVRLTLAYLLGTATDSGAEHVSDRPISKVRRRKSELLEARLEREGFSASPGLFNLADVVTSSLSSGSEQTITAALQLLSTMIRRQYRRSLKDLLKTRQAGAEDRRRTVGGQEKEVDTLLAFAESMAGTEDLEPIYEAHLSDARTSLETHPCSVLALSKPAPDGEDVDRHEREIAKAAMNSRILNPHASLFKAVISLLDNFFSHEIETNLSLTQVVVDLAACGVLRMEGWLLTDPAKYVYWDGSTVDAAEPDEGKSQGPHARDELASLRAINACRREPSWKPEDVSPISGAIDALVQQVETFHKDISEFDAHLQECREFFAGHDKTDTPVPSFGTPSRTPRESARASPSRNPTTSSMTERLRSDRAFGGNATPSSTPRGRQVDFSLTPTPGSRLGQQQQHSSPKPLGKPPPTSHSRNQSRTLSSSPFLKAIAGSPSKQPSALSQAQFRGPSAAMQRKVRISSMEEPPLSPDEDDDSRIGEPTDSETNSIRSATPSTSSDGTMVREGRVRPGRDEVTLGHLLTNVIILQEFIAELAAVVEVRGALFDEIRYS